MADLDEDRPTLLLVSVEARYDGEMTLQTTEGETHTERTMFLDLSCLVGDTGARMPITLAIPVSSGPRLLQALLTEDQWDAVMSC